MTAITRRPVGAQSSRPASASVDIAALADQVQAGRIVTCPSVEATGDLMTELGRRGRVRWRSEWRGNTLLIVVGPRESEGDIA